MGMLNIDYPRVKTKEERKQDRIKDVEYDINKLNYEVDDLEEELQNLLNPDFIKNKIEHYKKIIGRHKIKITNAKKKLNKLTRKES